MYRLQTYKASASKFVDRLTATADSMREAVPDAFRFVIVALVSVMTCFSARKFVDHLTTAANSMWGGLTNGFWCVIVGLVSGITSFSSI
jgi:hypothetical protein